MRKLFIIAHSWDGLTPEIHTTWNAAEATGIIAKHTDDQFSLSVEGLDPETYLGKYQDWIREENDNMCDNSIALHIETVYDALPAKKPAGQRALIYREEDLSDDLEKQMYAAFKIWRKDRAQEIGIPEFMILHNQSLVAIAKAKPQRPEDLPMIKGLGQQKITRYGDDILAIVNAFI